MNCATVRDRLTEHAFRALPAREASSIDRHLLWCAACRKEAGHLQAASATLAFALAPEEPSPELEDRILGVIRSAAARRVPPGGTAPRRSRLALVAAITAMLAVLGTGWGAVMAGRAARSDEVARDVPPLPAHLGAAVAVFQESDWATETFGADVMAHYAEAGRWEWERFLAADVVTEWERRRYFEVV